MNEKELDYEIVSYIATLSTSDAGVTKELNVIKWGDKPECYDLRAWSKEHKPFKGLTMTASELTALRDALANMELEDEVKAGTANVKESSI